MGVGDSASLAEPPGLTWLARINELSQAFLGQTLASLGKGGELGGSASLVEWVFLLASCFTITSQLAGWIASELVQKKKTDKKQQKS